MSAPLELPTPPSANPLRAAGMVLPGLGHLLDGNRIVGLGMILLAGELLWAAVIGLPQAGHLLVSPTSPMFAAHPWVAALTWLLVRGTHEERMACAVRRIEGMMESMSTRAHI